MKTFLTYLLIVSLSFLMINNSYAQTEEKLKANDLFQQKKFEDAKVVIDAVVLHKETKDDPEAWTFKAYIYQKLYKQYEQSKLTTNYLDEAVKSAKSSMSLDKENLQKENNVKLLTACWQTYQKTYVKLIQDSLDYEKSNAYFNKYVETRKITEPTYNEKQDFIEYNKTVASRFVDLYTNNGFNPKFGDIAKLACLKILDIEPKDFQANYIMAVVYYNQAASISREMDYDFDIKFIEIEEERAKKLFKQSEPLMLIAYELDPTSTRVLKGLQGIYNGLLEFDKAKEFENKLTQLKKQD